MSICGTSSSQKDFGVTGHIGHSAPPPVPKTSPASADRKSAGPVALPGPQPKRLQRWKAFAYRFFMIRNWGFAGKSRGTLLLRNDVWVWVSHGMKRCPEKQDQTKKLDYQLWIGDSFAGKFRRSHEPRGKTCDYDYAWRSGIMPKIEVSFAAKVPKSSSWDPGGSSHES